MTQNQFGNLLTQHEEVVTSESNNFDYFMTLITEELTKKDLPKEYQTLLESAFDNLFEAKKLLLQAKINIKIAKETTNE